MAYPPSNQYNAHMQHIAAELCNAMITNRHQTIQRFYPTEIMPSPSYCVYVWEMLLPTTRYVCRRAKSVVDPNSVNLIRPQKPLNLKYQERHKINKM